jgi:hypothetical protein
MPTSELTTATTAAPNPATAASRGPDEGGQKSALDAVLCERLARLSSARAVHLPPAPPSVEAALMLASGATADGGSGEPAGRDDVSMLFSEYFRIGRVDGGPDGLGRLRIPDALRACYGEEYGSLPPWSRCFALDGRRGSVFGNRAQLRAIFLGDLVWLYFMERMGLFEMLGALVDDFAIRGKLALRNQSYAGYGLEAWIRDTIAGQTTSVRQRLAAYMRALGWRPPTTTSIPTDAIANRAFNELFHKFVYLALEYYKDLRLAHAIRGASLSGGTSVATFTTLRDTLALLRNAFDAFGYGRVAASTQNGIVGILGSLAFVRDVRPDIGVPSSFSRIEQYIPAAYELLVAGRPGNASGVNRYTVHKECATYARNLLLQMEVLELDNRPELELWLAVVEDQIEGYRTAYRTLTGTDLGASPSPVIEQAA